MAYNFPSYEEWRGLDERQKDYILWQTLNSVNELNNSLNNRFAGKWVERAVYTVSGIIVAFIVNGVLNGTFKIR